MSFLSPERFLWLLAALPIIAFYILKTRLRRREVSTLLFWDQLFDEKRQRSLWQNLRHWISLLLQLAFVGLLTFALVDPLWNADDDSGQEMILVLDNSASMQAIDPESGRTRFEIAVQEATKVAGGLRPGDKLALVTAGNTVRVVVGMSDFAPTVQESLQTLTTTDGPTRINEAIDAARRLASDDDRRRVLIFSDVGVTQRDAIKPEKDIRWIPVGTSGDKPQNNVAVTVFQVRRSTVDPIGYSLLVRIENFSDESATGRLKLTLADSLVDVIPYTIEPYQRWQKTIEATSQSGGILLGSIDSDDALAVDNTARAILPSRPTIPVRLNSDDTDEDESTQSYYLTRVLQSIPLIKIIGSEQDQDQEADSPEEDSGTVLNVYAGSVPESLPDGPILFVDVRSDGPSIDADGKKAPAWTIGKGVDDPIIAKQDKTSPLLRHVQLQNVIMAGGRDIEINSAVGEAKTLLETADGQKVLVAVERPEGRLLILAADLDGSDLPLRIAFPVMMTNATNWFFRETGQMNPSLFTGQIAEVPWDVAALEFSNSVNGSAKDDLDDDISSGEDSLQNDSLQKDPAQEIAMLVRPDGTRQSLTVDDDLAAIGPLRNVGVYGIFQPSKLSEYDATQQESESEAAVSPESLVPIADGEMIAVNLCDANESDLRIPKLSQEQRSTPPPAGVLPWFILTLLGIGLVATEWALFNRRVVA